MATTYDSATRPQLESLSCVREEGGKTPAGAPYAAPAGYQWTRLRYLITLYRIVERLQSFLPAVNVGDDSVIQMDVINWTGGETTLQGSADLPCRCTGHNLEPEYPGTSIYRERVTYEYVSLWVLETASEQPATNNELTPEAGGDEE